MFGEIACQVGSMIVKARAREEWIKSLPKDEADLVRADDARITRENELHWRQVEIAEAGRARNFWGK